MNILAIFLLVIAASIIGAVMYKITRDDSSPIIRAYPYIIWICAAAMAVCAIVEYLKYINLWQ